jgi:hypothetical protein
MAGAKDAPLGGFRWFRLRRRNLADSTQRGAREALICCEDHENPVVRGAGINQCHGVTMPPRSALIIMPSATSRSMFAD